MSHADASFSSKGSVSRLLGFLSQNAGSRTLPLPKELPATTHGRENRKCSRQRFEQLLLHRRSVVEMVAHDIRTPLMSSQISVELVEELAAHISEGGQKGLESVHQILDYSVKMTGFILKHSSAKNSGHSAPQPAAPQEANIPDKTAARNLILDLNQATSCLTKEIRVLLMDALNLLSIFELLEKKNLNSLCIKHLLRAQNGIGRGVSLINDQLQIESFLNDSAYLHKSSCSVALVTGDATASLKGLSDRKKIRLVNTCGSELLYIDRSKITQVLINFLSNAIKFSPERKSIVLSSGVSETMIRIVVTDEGPGIDQGTEDYLFERSSSSSVNRDQHGYGLGLFFCKLIAEAHGGQVGVDGRKGSGCSFWIELPR